MTIKCSLLSVLAVMIGCVVLLGMFIAGTHLERREHQRAIAQQGLSLASEVSRQVEAALARDDLTTAFSLTSSIRNVDRHAYRKLKAKCTEQFVEMFNRETSLENYDACCDLIAVAWESPVEEGLVRGMKKSVEAAKERRAQVRGPFRLL